MKDKLFLDYMKHGKWSKCRWLSAKAIGRHMLMSELDTKQMLQAMESRGILVRSPYHEEMWGLRK